MDASKLSLSKLRAQLRGLGDEEGLHRLGQALRCDTRAGARALGVSADRRLAALRAERERMAELFALRERLRSRGVRLVAGVDEVGVGPLAGPVVAAAVVLPDAVDLPGLDDSKKLSRSARERLDAAIREQALGIGIGEVSHQEIDRRNIFQASLEAMRRAVKALPAEPDHLLVDARHIGGISIEQTALVHGDARDGSIAAASIVAKVYRDALMTELDQRYPGYGFARHMGYGTPQHLAALQRLGATPVHRRSFRVVAAVLPS